MRIQTLDLPPDAGRRLFPQVIEDLALRTPERIIYEFATGTKVEDGFRTVSCQQYANSINRVSWFLDETLGKATSNETVGYVGLGDLRYLILTVAAVKTGRKMLFVSPKNSLDGHLSVLEAANCNIWLTTTDYDQSPHILDKRPMQIVQLPNLADVLDPTKVETYPYEKTYDEAKDDPCWVLHTSGSTGLPKPVLRFMSSTASNESHLLCGPIEGRPLLIDETIGARICMTFPLFHSFGLSNGLLWPIYCDQTVVLAPDAPLTTSVLNDMMDLANVDIVVTAPSTVEDLAKSKSSLARLSKLRAISFGGGPLSQEVGDIICERTKLILIMGTSEAGWLTSVDTDRQDWNYLHFHPNTGLELRPHSSGLHELVAVRKPELAQWQTVFTTFPDLQEYSFKDLFSKHPTKANLWHYEGRSDNIIVLSNGEKVNPTSMELAISLNPIVKSVLVYGQSRFQISALVELDGPLPCSDDMKKSVMEQLLPSITMANQQAPKHGQLSPDYVIFTTPQKPFLRAGKGTVQKQLTLELYASELEDLYDSADKMNSPKMDTSSLEAVTDHIRNIIHKNIGLKDLSDIHDVFVGGADSLQAINILRHVRNSLQVKYQSGAGAVDVATVYENPTIAGLSLVIWRLVQPAISSSPMSIENDKTEAMQAMLDKYTFQSNAIGTRNDTGACGLVVLTGSSGSLGSYLLDDLIRSQRGKEIWCLNRTSNGEESQSAISSGRGLKVQWARHAVCFRQADLSQERLGLSRQDYDYIKDKVTQVIHVQWPVDFNLSLSSFEPHIAGVANLIRLSRESPHVVPITFISSVGVAGNWQGANGCQIPEEIISDFSAASMGYGQSKLVAEHLLVRAQKYGVPSTILRIGQIAGPVTFADKGMWNRKEWLPTIMDASAYMNTLPDTLGKQDEITWIPVEIMARIVLELSVDSMPPAQEPRVFTVTNPQVAEWKDLYPVAARRLAATSEVQTKVVSWDVWLGTLRSRVEGSHSGEELVPGAKLLPFFESMAREDMPQRRYDTMKAKAVSPSMKVLGPVSPQWMEVWMAQWGYPLKL